MTPIMRRILLMLALLSAGPAFAQASADLSLQATIAPAGPLRGGTEATITLTLTNLGPVEIKGSGVVTSDYPFLIGGYFDLYGAGPHPCPVYYDDFIYPPGETSYLIAAILAGDLAVGASRTCTLGLFIYPESEGNVYDLSFRADSGTPDDNEANDTVAFQLVFAKEAPPSPIPGVSPLTLGMLAGVLAVAARSAIRRA